MTEAENQALEQWKAWATPERTERAFEAVFSAAYRNDGRMELMDLQVIVGAVAKGVFVHQEQD